mmetsp:Transcript_92449/g.270624  ORF Transcript_92449/g.270624 Transcript_92449/m.270624 type:complete len:219 (-) Transcript_92449:65-721(-)
MRALIELFKEGGHLRPILLVHDDVGGLRNGLNAGLISTQCNTKEAILAPIGTPAVLDLPVLLAALFTPAHQQHGMVHLLPLLGGAAEEAGVGRGAVDAVGVEHEVLGRLQAQHQRAVPVELRLDGLDAGVPVPRAHVAVVRGSVALARQGAEVALEAAGAARVVPHAGAGEQAHVLRPLGREDAVASIAALVVLGAEEGEVDRPGRNTGVILLDSVAR